MTLKDIMSISGSPGLYRFISQGRNGIIVESLTDGKRTHIPASAKASALSDIAVFTLDGEKPLREVLEAVKLMENSQPSISHKADNSVLKAHFLKVVPNFDSEKVYFSDIKKVFSWYNQLQAINMLDFIEPIEEKTEDIPSVMVPDEHAAHTKPKTKKPSDTKTSAPKKGAAAAKADTLKAAPKGAAPVKKANVRKKAV